jgi:phosphoribosyl 1,2-cyclic phosphodiesterase
MRVHILGVRGSTPATGPEFVRYGGHTSCIALAHDGEAPSLLVDAGTGIRRASALLDGKPFVGTVLLGHMHWDHTQGLPFFRAGDSPGAQVTLYAPAQPEGKIEAVLGRAMSPPHFPITPAGLRGRWAFAGLEPGEFEIEGFSVAALEIPHKGGRTFGYRISDGRAALAYLSDHCPTSLGPGPDGLGERHKAALWLTRDCDAVFHDGQYTDEELPVRAYFGHSSWGYALALAEAAGAKRLFICHHDPDRTDDELDQIAARYAGAQVNFELAAEGRILRLGPGRSGNSLR